MSGKAKSLRSLDPAHLGDEILREYELEEFGLKELNVSSRVLQHWSERGILPDKNRETDENHKFNFVELIWLKIVIELRSVGVSLRSIKEVKHWFLRERSITEILQIKESDNLAERLYEFWAPRVKDKKVFMAAFSDKQVADRIRKKKFPPLWFYILGYMTEKSNFQAVVFPEGQAGVVSSRLVAQDDVLKEYMGTHTHVIVPFYRVFKEILQDERYSDFLERAHVLNDNELLLLGLYRSGKANKITIHFKNGQPEILEVQRHTKVQMEARLTELILKEGYREITVKTNSGNVSFASVTDKFKLK
jgi:DNA-binding transcriptional MerR regulator